MEAIMRRQDRMVTNIDEIKGILNSTRIIHLGMMDGNYPYVVPLHFGYEFIDDVLHIFVHGHHEGKKFSLMQANPHVFIEIDGDDEALVSGGDIPCKYSSVYSSVMGRGEATYIDNIDEKEGYEAELVLDMKNKQLKQNLRYNGYMLSSNLAIQYDSYHEMLQNLPYLLPNSYYNNIL